MGKRGFTETQWGLTSRWKEKPPKEGEVDEGEKKFFDLAYRITGSSSHGGGVDIYATKEKQGKSWHGIKTREGKE